MSSLFLFFSLNWSISFKQFEHFSVSYTPFYGRFHTDGVLKRFVFESQQSGRCLGSDFSLGTCLDFSVSELSHLTASRGYNEDL